MENIPVTGSTRKGVPKVSNDKNLPKYLINTINFYYSPSYNNLKGSRDIQFSNNEVKWEYKPELKLEKNPNETYPKSNTSESTRPRLEAQCNNDGRNTFNVTVGSKISLYWSGSRKSSTDSKEKAKSDGRETESKSEGSDKSKTSSDSDKPSHEQSLLPTTPDNLITNKEEEKQPPREEEEKQPPKEEDEEQLPSVEEEEQLPSVEEEKQLPLEGEEREAELRKVREEIKATTLRNKKLRHREFLLMGGSNATTNRNDWSSQSRRSFGVFGSRISTERVISNPDENNYYQNSGSQGGINNPEQDIEAYARVQNLGGVVIEEETKGEESLIWNNYFENNRNRRENGERAIQDPVRERTQNDESSIDSSDHQAPSEGVRQAIKTSPTKRNSKN